MKDFPPPLTHYTPEATTRPDTASPARFLRWLVREQIDLVAVAALCSMLWMLPATLTPWILGRAIDDGVLAGDGGRLGQWLAALLVVTVLGAGSGVLYHTTAVRSWLVASYGTTSLVTNKTIELGHVLPRRVPTGEALSVSGSDGHQFGSFLEIVARAMANLVSYVVVATIVLSVDLELGLVVLTVAPLLVLVSAPLLRPMSRAQHQERSRDSELTGRATDIVAGLRILRGIGGETTFGNSYAAQSQRVRRAGVRAGFWAAVVEATGVALSGGFVIVLAWLGIAKVHSGELAIGELITFLGYALFLLNPIRVFFEATHKVARALVSARKAVAVLSQPNPWPGAGPGASRGPAADPDPQVSWDPRGELVDEVSGLRVRPGSLTVLVSAVPEETAALADRLGRYLPGGFEPLPIEPGDDLAPTAAKAARAASAARRAELLEQDRRRAHEPWGVSLGGVDLSRVPLRRVRETILVSDTGSQLFAGTLQEAVDPRARLTRTQAEQAMHCAAAEDVYEIVPGGWQGLIDERGRGLSGGQRQRLVLARALATDAPVLVLVEPTSAVDAHTEALIAARLRPARRGRTTVVTSVSPLLLHQADDIAVLQNGRVVATGSHAELVASCPAYRTIVLRGERPAPSPSIPAASVPQGDRP